MRTKRRKLITAVFSLLGICLLGILLVFAVPTSDTTIASAAGTPRYKMYFDYKYYSGTTLANEVPPLELKTEKTNVLKSDAHICASPAKTCEIEFEIYGSYYDDTMGTLAQGGTIKSSEVNIVVVGSSYAGNSFQIKNASGVVVASASSPSKSIKATLDSGTYYFTFTGFDDWENDGPIRDVHRAVKIECTFYFKVDSHVHSYTSTLTPATCTTGGYTTYKCSCGDSYTGNQTSSLGHSYSATTTSATCTSGGYTTYKCSRCSSSYTGNQTTALEHSYTIETSTTCTGEKIVYSCSRCNYSYTETTMENGSGHSFSAKTTAATCTADGYTVYTCSKCGYSYQDAVAKALGHSYTVVQVSTCTGQSTKYTCSRCGDTYIEATGDGTGHSYVASITEATCTEGGYTIYKCSRCGASYRDNETSAIGHNYSPTVVTAGCTSSGYTLYTCTRCGSSYRSGDTQPTGHNYVSTSFPATCAEGGYTLHVCDRCGAEYQDNETQPLGHNFVTTTEPPTCTASGKTVYTCQVCEYRREERDDTLPSGHSYVNTITRVATCVDSGLRHLLCEKCGYEYDETIRAKGHNYSITDISTSNDITRRTYTCSTCGDRYTQELGNQYENVSNYVEYLFEQYSPYMFWVLLATAGLWSIAIGIALIIAVKNEDKAKAKKMLANYLIGLVVIFAIIVACPYLVRGIAALVT